ncbi:hypothetical protein BC835DRAFT_1419036 [Cytidiella melzeri]|nr:hypothetical protein BC835DRAFT_1419036 [Cytidiella melzeri]
MSTLSGSCLSSFLAPEDCLQASQHSQHLRTRDGGSGGLSGTTSFGIIIAVGFAGFVLICACTSKAYRRVSRQYQAILDAVPEAQAEDGMGECPVLWDVTVQDGEKLEIRDWRRVLPLSASLTNDECSDILPTKSIEATGTRKLGRLRAHKDPYHATQRLRTADIAVLIAMPSPRNSSRYWESVEKSGRHQNEKEEPWSGCALGITSVGYCDE